MYAVAWEDNDTGCVEYVFDHYDDAVAMAFRVFANGICYGATPDAFNDVFKCDETILRVDVYECDNMEDADEQFIDALFTPLFHIDNGMDFTD